MRRLILAATALSLVASSAQAMSVAEFLAKANALKAKGMAVMFSSDIGLPKAEMKTVAEAYRADLAASRAAGRPPQLPAAQGEDKDGQQGTARRSRNRSAG